MKALSGIKIISLCVNLPGPFAAFRLSEMGAEVTKIEPENGDPLFHARPDFYHKLSSKQKIIKLNLKEKEDSKKLYSLLENADLLLTSNRLDSLARLGLSWNVLHIKFPKLCMISIVGHREENHPGHDLTYQAEAGLLSPPLMPLAPMADMLGAERVVSKSLALILNRLRSNQSAHEIVALAESADIMALPLKYKLTGSKNILGGAHPTYNLYETKKGWIAVAALENHFSEKLKEHLQLEKLSIESLKNIFIQKTSDEWDEWARSIDIPLVKVQES